MKIGDKAIYIGNKKDAYISYGVTVEIIGFVKSTDVHVGMLTVKIDKGALQIVFQDRELFFLSEEDFMNSEFAGTLVKELN